jgi:hypothetical protein
VGSFQDLPYRFKDTSFCIKKTASNYMLADLSQSGHNEYKYTGRG